MDILDLERTVNPEWWMNQIANCDWTAGPYLYGQLKDGSFHAHYGKNARVLVLADGTKLVSFCTYAQRDEITDTELTPWLGFVYTHPDYRGRRLMAKLIARVKELARDDGYDTLYISTGETGLYEKYGAEFVTFLNNERDEESRIYRMDTFAFHGWENAACPKKITDYPGIETPRDLYAALWHVWRKDTCAPRMQKDWSEENRTLGQCSITAFLAQDIFGGKVWGIPLPEGGFHCFNVTDVCTFDLTSEQFGDRKLDYTNKREQFRYEHFQKDEKRARYETIKARLEAYLTAAQRSR